jgi:hypothetical protein
MEVDGWERVRERERERERELSEEPATQCRPAEKAWVPGKGEGVRAR